MKTTVTIILALSMTLIEDFSIQLYIIYIKKMCNQDNKDLLIYNINSYLNLKLNLKEVYSWNLFYYTLENFSMILFW